MCCIGKVFRVVTSLVLGVGGATLLSHCTPGADHRSTCFSDAIEEGTSKATAIYHADSTSCSQSWSSFQNLEKGCLVGGVIYGAASLLVLGQVVTSVMTCCRKRENLRRNDCCSFRPANPGKCLESYISRALAGGRGSMYGINNDALKCVECRWLYVERSRLF